MTQIVKAKLLEFCRVSDGIRRFQLVVFQLGMEIPLVRILVVDDNPAVRHYVRAILEQQIRKVAWISLAVKRVNKSPPSARGSIAA